MALNPLQAMQLSTLLAGHAKMFTANNPGQNEFADYLLKSGQAGTMGLLAEEEEKKRKKKEKGLLGGKIGATLGTVAGIALAPVTGGASLAAAGALGGGLGGLAGQYIAGGSPSASSFALDAAQGGLSGYQFGKQGELAESVKNAAVQPNVPGSPPVAYKMSDAIMNAIPNSNVLSEKVQPGTGPLLNPGMSGVPRAAQRTRPPLGQRIKGAFNQVMNPYQPTGRLQYITPGGYEIWQ
jgi:hypothetical protein